MYRHRGGSGYGRRRCMTSGESNLNLATGSTFSNPLKATRSRPPTSALKKKFNPPPGARGFTTKLKKNWQQQLLLFSMPLPSSRLLCQSHAPSSSAHEPASFPYGSGVRPAYVTPPPLPPSKRKRDARACAVTAPKLFSMRHLLVNLCGLRAGYYRKHAHCLRVA